MEYEVAHLADELASAHLCDIDNSTAASTGGRKKGLITLHVLHAFFFWTLQMNCQSHSAGS
jgi:hypothetical protein